MKKHLLLLFVVSSVFAEELPDREIREQGYFTDSAQGFCPISARIVAEVSPNTDTIQLDDGSIWRINSTNRSDLFLWKINDLVVISQNTSWFSSYRFSISNKTANSTVQAEITLGPILGGPNTHRAVSVDSFHGQLILDNGSVWEIAYADSSLFAGWLANDTIMIGKNRSWLSSGDFILIDIENNNFVRANLIQ